MKDNSFHKYLIIKAESKKSCQKLISSCCSFSLVLSIFIIACLGLVAFMFHALSVGIIVFINYSSNIFCLLPLWGPYSKCVRVSEVVLRFTDALLVLFLSTFLFLSSALTIYLLSQTLV